MFTKTFKNGITQFQKKKTHFFVQVGAKPYFDLCWAVSRHPVNDPGSGPEWPQAIKINQNSPKKNNECLRAREKCAVQ